MTLDKPHHPRPVYRTRKSASATMNDVSYATTNDVWIETATNTPEHRGNKRLQPASHAQRPDGSSSRLRPPTLPRPRRLEALLPAPTAETIRLHAFRREAPHIRRAHGIVALAMPLLPAEAELLVVLLAFGAGLAVLPPRLPPGLLVLLLCDGCVFEGYVEDVVFVCCG